MQRSSAMLNAWQRVKGRRESLGGEGSMLYLSPGRSLP
jgi:hypothetical protein